MDDASQKYIRETLTGAVSDLRMTADGIETVLEKSTETIDIDELERLILKPKAIARTLAEVERYARKVVRRHGRTKRISRRGGPPITVKGGPGSEKLVSPNIAPNRLKVTLKGVKPTSKEEVAKAAATLPPPPVNMTPRSQILRPGTQVTDE